MLYNYRSGSEIHHNGNIFKGNQPKISSLSQSCEILLVC